MTHSAPFRLTRVVFSHPMGVNVLGQVRKNRVGHRDVKKVVRERKRRQRVDRLEISRHAEPSAEGHHLWIDVYAIEMVRACVLVEEA